MCVCVYVCVCVRVCVRACMRAHLCMCVCATLCINSISDGTHTHTQHNLYKLFFLLLSFYRMLSCTVLVVSIGPLSGHTPPGVCKCGHHCHSTHRKWQLVLLFNNLLMVNTSGTIITLVSIPPIYLCEYLL